MSRHFVFLERRSARELCSAKSDFGRNCSLLLFSCRGGALDPRLMEPRRPENIAQKDNFEHSSEMPRPKTDTIRVLTRMRRHGYSAPWLGRSLRDLLNIAEMLRDRDVALRSLTDHIDTSAAAGRVVGAVAQFERARAHRCRARGRKAPRQAARPAPGPDVGAGPGGKEDA